MLPSGRVVRARLAQDAHARPRAAAALEQPLRVARLTAARPRRARRRAPRPRRRAISASAVGAEHRGEHVRALGVLGGRRRASRRRRRSAARAPPARGCAVARDRPRRARPSCGSRPGSAPWSAASAGRTNSWKVTIADTGLPGRPKASVVAARAEPGRLARDAGCTPQKRSSTPSAASAALTWSCGPTETPPETHHDVGRVERRAERRAGGVGAVGHALARDELGARALHLPGQRVAVRAVDAARARAARPGSVSSSPVTSSATRGRRAHDDASRGRPTRPRRARPGPARRPRRSTTSPARDVLAGAADVGAGLGGRARARVSSGALGALDRHDGGGALGHRGARWRCAIAAPGPRPPPPAGWPARDSPISSQLGRRRRRPPRSRPWPSCRTAAPRSSLANVLGEHPPERLARARTGSRRQRPHRLEHPAARLCNRDQVGHPAGSSQRPREWWITRSTPPFPGVGS